MSAPIDHLPPELLSHIFVTLYKSCLYARSVGDRSHGRTDYPTLFSSVSNRWRQVAINTPPLWTCIHLGEEERILENLSHVNLYLQRSRDSPLSVQLGRRALPCHLSIVNEYLAHLLHSLAIRLDALTIVYMYKTFAERVMSTLVSQGAAGQLKKLSLYSDLTGSRIVAGDSITQERLDQLLQPLRTLYLESVSLDWDIIACRNLVDLQIVYVLAGHAPSILQIAQFLNANPALRRLRFAKVELHTFEEFDLPRIILPELQTLELDVNHYFICSLLQSLTPVAQKLSLDLCSYYDPSYKDQMIDTLSRFFQQNRIASLRISRGGWLPFSNVLAHLQDLEILGLQDRCLYSYGLREADQKGLLPKLKTIELTRVETREVELGLSYILCLPSVKNIDLCQCNFEDDVHRMSLSQVREWLSGLGVTAAINESPRLQFSFHPSPFV